MATFRTELRAALRLACEVAWPEVADNGIYYPSQIARLSLDEKAKLPELPFAVIDLSGPMGLRPEHRRFGIANHVEAGIVDLYYVMADDLKLDTLEARLQTLQQQLADIPLSTGQVLGWPGIDPEPNIPGYLALMGTGRPIVIGQVYAEVCVGVTP